MPLPPWMLLHARLLCKEFVLIKFKTSSILSILLFDKVKRQSISQSHIRDMWKDNFLVPGCSSFLADLHSIFGLEIGELFKWKINLQFGFEDDLLQLLVINL